MPNAARRIRKGRTGVAGRTRSSAALLSCGGVVAGRPPGVCAGRTTKSTPDRAPKNIGNALKALPRRTRRSGFSPTLIVGGTFDAVNRPSPGWFTFQLRNADPTMWQSIVRHWRGSRPVSDTSDTRCPWCESPSLRIRCRPPWNRNVGQRGGGRHRLRTVGPGRLDLLERVHQQSIDGNRRIESPDVPYTSYRPVSRAPPTCRRASSATLATGWSSNERRAADYRWRHVWR